MMIVFYRWFLVPSWDHVISLCLQDCCLEEKGPAVLPHIMQLARRLHAPIYKVFVRPKKSEWIAGVDALNMQDEQSDTSEAPKQ